jgi:hypothetical protein
VKGIIELPVVAIFSIVAGGLIILLLVTVGTGLTARAETNIEASSLQRIDPLLKTAAASPDTQSNITIIDKPIIFTCDESGVKFAYESHRELPLPNLVVFSSNRLEGGQLQTHTKKVDAAFNAANILYLTTPQQLYENATDLRGFPEGFSIVEPTSTTASRRTIIDESQYGPAWSSAKDLVILYPAPGKDYGTLQYGTSSANTVYYPNKELMYGAIISKDSQTYNCVFDIYLQQLKWSASIERERVARLKDEYYAQRNSCWSLYQTEPFDTILALPAAEDFGASASQSLADATSSIRFMNDNVIRGDNCAWIY